jgi:hypothetical protein
MRKRKEDWEIEEVAWRLRELLGFVKASAPCMATVLDRLTAELPGFSYRILLDADLPEAAARTCCETMTIELRASLYQAMLAGDRRARMTIAHELGHVVLGHNGVRFRKDDPEKRHGIEKIEESEAKFFGGAFLAPSKMARKYDNPSDLALQFQISDHAAQVRHEQIERDRAKKLPPGIKEFIQEMKNKHGSGKR